MQPYFITYDYIKAVQHELHAQAERANKRDSVQRRKPSPIKARLMKSRRQQQTRPNQVEHKQTAQRVWQPTRRA